MQDTELTADLPFHCKVFPWAPTLLPNGKRERQMFFSELHTEMYHNLPQLVWEPIQKQPKAHEYPVLPPGKERKLALFSKQTPSGWL